MKVPAPRKMSSGNWYINMRLGGESINVTEPTEKACIRSAQLIKAEYLAGKREEKLTPKKLTLSQAIDIFISERTSVISPSTIRGYRNTQKNHLQDLMQMDINDITADIVQRSVNIARKRYSAKTISNDWRFIKTIIAQNTGKKIEVKIPQVILNPSEFLDEHQIPIFLDAVHDTQFEIPALFALCSLRQSEILGLDWEDIDLEKRLASVLSAVVPDESNHFVKKDETKNQASRRLVPLIPPLVSALLAVEDKTGPVVKMSASWMYKGIKRICTKAGLPAIGPHGLRHSFASLAQSLGLPESVAMEIGGWSDPATMRKIYTHVSRVNRLTAQNAMTNYYDNFQKAK